jgi:hypothetical protein
VVASTSSDDAGGDAASYQKLQKQDALARQALLACLASEELTKVYHLKSSHEIWRRLADEYGTVSDLKRAQASATFYSLQKKHSMSAKSRWYAS